MRTVIVSVLTCLLTLGAINVYQGRVYHLAQARQFFNAYFGDPPPPPSASRFRQQPIRQGALY